MLRDAKRLHDYGFAIHWLREKSKAPVSAKWTTGDRHPFSFLKATYKKEYNIGVRLGRASKIGDHYLAVIDCDVKSKDKKHLSEMENKLLELGITYPTPVVLSGRGNGSKHIYVKTLEPLPPARFAQSKEMVKVLMPSVKPSKRDIETLTKQEIYLGFRSRPAWEISLMGEGQQVVLPPSIHPDSGKSYQWQHEWRGSLHSQISLLDIKILKSDKGLKEPEGEEPLVKFKPENVDLYMSKLSDELVSLIVEGANCSDRSAAMFSTAMTLVREGFTKNQVLSILTDKENYLGHVAYDHAKTNSRTVAAAWVNKYTFQKAKKTALLDAEFPDEVKEPEKLGIIEAAVQAKEMKNINWRDGLQRNQNDGNPKSSFHNIRLILKSVMNDRFFLARNEFAVEDHWILDTPWGCKAGTTVRDDDSVLVKEWLSKNFRFEPARDKIEEVLIWFTLQNTYHPVRDFLDALEWDGKPRIDTWLKTYLNAKGAPDAYLKAVGTQTLLGMVARIYDPGCKFDYVLILEGNQGIGKSSTARILAGDKWFSDSDLNIGDKDSVVNMQGIWVYELGELSAMSRYDVNRLKEFVSRSTDKIRPPYGKRTINYPRQSIFIGTTNNDEYLKDKTGNRRYYPVKVGKVKMSQLKIDRDQLLAEAVHRYLLGEDIWIKDALTMKLIQHEQGLRVEHDELEDQLKHFLEDAPENLNVESFKIHELIKVSPFLSGVKNDRALQVRVGSALRSLGYEKTVKRDENSMSKFWVKKDVTLLES